MPLPSHPITPRLPALPEAGVTCATLEEHFVRASKADRTLRAYRSALEAFQVWSGIDNPFPTSEAVVRAYLTEQAGRLAPSTLDVHLAALRWAHERMGFPNPAGSPRIRELMSGIRREAAKAGWRKQQARVLSLEDARTLLGSLAGANTLTAIRDRALLLMGLLGAFRQSEIAGLTWGQLEELPDGAAILVYLGITKNDQEGGELRPKVFPRLGSNLCPVAAVETWRDVSGPTEDTTPVFRSIDRYERLSGQPLSHTGLNRILRARTEEAGLSTKGLSWHSLRSSFVTIARDLGVADHEIMGQTLHQDRRTLEAYYRPALRPLEGAAAKVGKRLLGHPQPFLPPSSD